MRPLPATRVAHVYDMACVRGIVCYLRRGAVGLWGLEGSELKGGVSGLVSGLGKAGDHYTLFRFSGPMTQPDLTIAKFRECRRGRDAPHWCSLSAFLPWQKLLLAVALNVPASLASTASPGLDRGSVPPTTRYRV